MKRILTVAFAILAVVVFVGGTCGPKKPATVTPELRMTIEDHVYYHNMGITFDGNHYFTVNGGNEDYCLFNEYDGSGQFEESHEIDLDGRAVFYHPDEEQFYVKSYGTGLYTYDVELEISDEESDDVFSLENGSPGFSPDGKFIYELANGEGRVIETSSGEEVRTFALSGVTGEEAGGYAFSIAASDKFLFAWRAEDEVGVYDLSGKYVTGFKLPRPGYGFSLSWCNGMLWTATDADGSSDGADGKWYGYKLTGLE